MVGYAGGNRLDEEKKSLGQEKTKLVRENEVKKGRLEELEKQLEEFVTVSPSLLHFSLELCGGYAGWDRGTHGR